MCQAVSSASPGGVSSLVARVQEARTEMKEQKVMTKGNRIDKQGKGRLEDAWTRSFSHVT